MDNAHEAEFQEDYYRLRQKTKELHEMLAKYEAGTLEYTLPCSASLLKKQLSAMEKYLYCLEVRAHAQGVRI